MGNKKKNIGKLISLFLVVLIFYFLGRKLFLNWQQIKEYQFSLDYFNLAISFVFLLVGVLARGLVWIVRYLQADPGFPVRRIATKLIPESEKTPRKGRGDWAWRRIPSMET